MIMSEHETRGQLIDRQLEKAGWRLDDRTQVRLEAPADLAFRETSDLNQRIASLKRRSTSSPTSSGAPRTGWSPRVTTSPPAAIPVPSLALQQRFADLSYTGTSACGRGSANPCAKPSTCSNRSCTGRLRTNRALYQPRRFK